MLGFFDWPVHVLFVIKYVSTLPKYEKRDYVQQIFKRWTEKNERFIHFTWNMTYSGLSWYPNTFSIALISLFGFEIPFYLTLIGEFLTWSGNCLNVWHIFQSQWKLKIAAGEKTTSKCLYQVKNDVSNITPISSSAHYLVEQPNHAWCNG